MTIAERLGEALTANAAPQDAAHEGWRVRTRDQAAWASRELARATRATPHAMEDRS